MKPTDTNEVFKKTSNNFFSIIPFILAMILLVSLITLIPKEFYIKLFPGTIFDPLIGALIGGISAGTPITSYIVGGELLNQGVSLVAITAFLLSWVTVGIIQFPAEASILGKKFAIYRNLTSFILAIIVAIATGAIYNAF